MMKIARITNIILAVSFLLAACTSLPPTDLATIGTQAPVTPPVVVDWDKSPENPVIVVTNCCGFVPDIVRINYIPEAVVWGDGRIVWSRIGDQGRRRILVGQLSEDQMIRLLEGIQNAGFFGWKELYSDMNGPTDMPSKCIKAEVDGREHQVCEYWQGAPEAFHTIFENLIHGAGIQGQPFVPEKGYLVAQRAPRPDRALEPGEFTVWDAGAAKVDLEDAVDGEWLEGEALLRAWDIVNAHVWGGLMQDGEDYYMLTLQIPGLTVEPIPGE